MTPWPSRRPSTRASYSRFIVYFLFLFVPSAGGARAQTNTGSLVVTVRDPSGLPMEGATIVLEREATGFKRSPDAVSGGTYRLATLPPGEGYRITVKHDGFATRSLEGLAVVVGETTPLAVTLEVGAPVFSVTVSEVAIETLDPNRTQLADVIERRSIDNLPINRRNYLDFALLTPGITETTVLPEANDYRVKIGPPAELSFSASSGRNGSYAIDGLSISAYSGNVRASLPQNAVQEFQVSRNGYPAEVGFSSGGAINIVSRSGTNSLHGGVFGFLRQRSIQARNYFDPGKSAYTRVQSGAELGGTLRPNRTFFFAAYERLDRQETVFVPILQDRGVLSRLKPSQESLLSFFDATGIPDLEALSAGLRYALTPTNNPFVQPLFDSGSGTFPFSGRINQGSLRLDHALSQRHTLFARFNITRDEQQNTRFGALQAWSSGFRTSIPDHSIVASDTWLLSPGWTVVLRGGFGSTRPLSAPNDPLGPSLIIEGFGDFGRDIFLPNRYGERYYELHPQLQRLAGPHTLTFGSDLNWITTDGDIHTYLGGRFVFGEYIPLGLVMNAATGDPSFAQTVAEGLAALGRDDLVPALDEPIDSLQAFALGLPAGYFQGFGATDYRTHRQQHAFYAEDVVRLRPSLTFNLGLRYQALFPSWIPSRHTLAPRIGLAWSPVAGDSLVVRAGYGIFHDTVISTMTFSHHQFQRDDLTLMLIPITGVPVNNPQTGAPLTSVDVWNHLLSNGILGQRSIRFEDLEELGIPPGFRFPIAGGIPDDYKVPYAQQAQISVERDFGGTTLGLDFEFSRSAHLWRILDSNLVQTGTRPDGWPILGRKDPNLANYFLHENSGNSWYYGATLRVDRRFQRHFSLNALYTFSRAIDDVTDYFIDYAPQNQLDKRSERALSLFHQKHRAVVSAVFESPSRYPLFADWKISPIFRANSSRPFNVLSGVDPFGDGQTTFHRPLGLGRNAGTGPNFVTLDFRLTRTIRLNERWGLDFTGEVFNLPNRTNFLSVNNVVGPVPLSSLPSIIRGNRDAPTEPLAYTSAGDPRQFQFGMRLYF